MNQDGLQPSFNVHFPFVISSRNQASVDSAVAATTASRNATV